MPASAFRHLSVGDRRVRTRLTVGGVAGGALSGSRPELHAAVAMAAGGEETCADAWIVRALREVVARAPDSFRG